MNAPIINLALHRRQRRQHSDATRRPRQMFNPKSMARFDIQPTRFEQLLPWLSDAGKLLILAIIALAIWVGTPA